MILVVLLLWATLCCFYGVRQRGQGYVVWCGLLHEKSTQARDTCGTLLWATLRWFFDGRQRGHSVDMVAYGEDSVNSKRDLYIAKEAYA